MSKRKTPADIFAALPAMLDDYENRAWRGGSSDYGTSRHAGFEKSTANTRARIDALLSELAASQGLTYSKSEIAR